MDSRNGRLCRTKSTCVEVTFPMNVRPVRGKHRGGGSSWQSLARGTGSIEADYLNGEVVLLGRLHGIATPVNEMLQNLANVLAREKRRPGTLEPAALLARLSEPL